MAHTHVAESGQRVPPLKKGLQRERNLQLSESLKLTPTLTMNINHLTKTIQQVEYVYITKKTMMVREVVKNDKYRQCTESNGG